jgi:glutaredoxin
VKEFLSRAGRSFTVRLVDEDDAAFEALMEIGYRSVPVTVIGQTIVQGYDPTALAKALEDAG